MRRNTNGSGFTLIELLIVVAIIGIIAAIAIPNLLNAIQRGKQKRTMGDMRTVATANESYSIDNNQYVVNAATTVGTIADNLEPTYVKKAPRNDGWNNPFQYEGTAAEYTMTAYGKGSTAGMSGTPSTAGGTTDFRDDMVFSTGSFVFFPEGTQK